MKYFDDFAEVSRWSASPPGYERMLKEFKINSSVVKDEEILFATYTYKDYSGDALIIFQRDGKLFEVNGSHCSCYGLEGQWEPEQTTWEALDMREFKYSDFAPETISFFQNLVKENAHPST